MAFAGFQKQINKANQLMNEKIGGVEGTKLDDGFVEMERQTDVMFKHVKDIQRKTKQFLHPNPASRSKMSAMKYITKLSGQAMTQTYPLPEEALGDAMITFGNKLGEESVYGESAYGTALVETGESLRQIADIKDTLGDNMKRNFLENLHNLVTKDINEVMYHRKKLQGRRLDYDCKKRKKEKGSTVSDDEIKMAEDKFAESLHLAEKGMHNLLENNVDAIAQLAMFAENLMDFHRQCSEIMEGLVNTLNDKKNDVANRPKRNDSANTTSTLKTLANSQSTRETRSTWPNV